MLPDIHLDQITFEEMLEQAKNRIAGCYPEWTDFNYHDPGITLMELFAWLKEIQQYEMNHIGDVHRQSYLQLLGDGTRHRWGADAFVSVRTEQTTVLPKGTRFVASGIPFETEEIQTLPGVSVADCFARSPERKRLGRLTGEQMRMGNPAVFYPFGRKAEPGADLYIRCLGPLPEGRVLRLTVRVHEGRQRPRNPVNKDTEALSAFTCSFWNGSGYRPAKIVRDETFGMLFDGQILFLLEEKMAPGQVDGEEGYFLRIRLEKSGYEMPPVVSFLDFNILKVKQKETEAVWIPAERQEAVGEYQVSHDLCIHGDLRVFLQEEELYREIPFETCRQEEQWGSLFFRPKEDLPSGSSLWVLAGRKEGWYKRHRLLGTGHGFPEECFLLEDARICQEELILLVEEADRPGYYRQWEQRLSFDRSGPEDFHYCVDGAEGRIRFGDGYHGRPPEGKILLAACTQVRGSEGNIKAHRLRPDPKGMFSDLEADNPWKASGGRDEESLPEAFERVRRALNRPGSMVTAEDYEEAVYRTPGLRIESCRAIFGSEGRDERVQIVVKPCSLEKRPGLTEVFVRNILRHLEPRRLLGTRILILPPQYICLSVYLEVAVRPQYQEAEAMIRHAAEDFLLPMRTQFGRSASYSGLYGQLDRLSCVFTIRSLLLEARGNGVQRSPYGDIYFPCNGIADEIEVACICSYTGE